MNVERREYLEMQLSAYLDGELTPQEQAEVESWLDADPEARRLLLQLRATIEAVQSLPRARASEELLGNLRTRLERKALLEPAGPGEGIAGAPALSWGRWVAVAAVIALAVTAGYFTWTLRSERNTVGPQLALRGKIPAYEPKATPEKIELGVTNDSVSVTGGAGEATAAEVAVRSSLESAAPAVKPATPASEAAPVLLAEGRARLELGDEEFAGGAEAPGSKGDRTAAAHQLSGRIAASAARREAEDTLGGKKVEIAQDFAAPLDATDGEPGVKQSRTRPVSRPQAAEGQARVLTFAFADQNSRAKAIELLRRRVLQDEAHAMAGVATRSRRAGTYGATMQFEATHPAEYRPQLSAPHGDGGRVPEEAIVTQPCEAGKVDTVWMLGGDVSPTEVKVTSIDTNPDSPVNVLKVVAVNKASADQLAAVLRNGDWFTDQYDGSLAKAEAVEFGRHKAKATSLTPARRSATAGESSFYGALADHDGDAVPDSLDLPEAFPEPSATQPSRDSSRFFDAETITPPGKPLDGLMTWDFGPVLEHGGRDLDMTNEQGVANQVFKLYSLAPTPDMGIALDKDNEAVPRAATLPAGSVLADASRRGGETGTTDRGVAGTGVIGAMEAGHSGYGGYGAAQREGFTSRYAGSSPAQSSSGPVSLVESRPSGGNLLVVYFEVLSPDTQPAGTSPASPPAVTDPTSQPAAHP